MDLGHDESQAMGHAPRTIEVRGACPHDCPDTCAWVATVEDGVVTGVHGDKAHPVTAGHLCVKMQRYEERLYHPDRLLTPLIRTGPKGSMASFRQATWDEALAVAAAGLQAAIGRGGPRSVLPFNYYGTQGVLQAASMDRRFFHRMGAADLDGTICYAAGAWAYGLTYGGWPETDIESVVDAELVVAWGANMVSTHLHLWPFFTEARKRGATIACVDPVRTRTARAADLHLALRPGTDAALALGMLHVIFAEGLEDREFLSTRTVGAAELEERAAQWPVDRAARVTGLDPGVIADFARRFAAARPAFVKLAPGAQRHGRGGQAFRAVLALPAVTGAWRHPGGGAHVHSASSFPSPGDLMTRPDLRPEGGGRRLVNMIQLGRALAGVTDDDGTPDPHGRIEGLVVYNANPMVVCPDTHAVRAGLARDDLFTVVIEQFPTETAAYADVVLPATTQLEHLDVLWSWGHRYVTLNRPAVPPRGQSRPNTEIFRRLAAAMGYDDPAFADTDEELVDTYLGAYDEATRAAVLEQGWAKVTPVADPDAKAMLRQDAVAEFGMDPVPDAVDPADGPAGETAGGHAGGVQVTVLTPKSHHFLNSSLVNHERLRTMAGGPTVLVSPADADAAGVADGSPVRLANDRGEVVATATVTDDVGPGTAALFSNWWHADLPGGNAANVLTGQDPADLGGAPVFTAVATLTPG